jgi:hypothetical protein
LLIPLFSTELKSMVLEVWFAAAAASAMPWTFLLGGLMVLQVLLWQAGRLLRQLWWQPRRLERALRAQGIRGTAYRFPAGDLREYGRLANKEAWSKPLPPRCHDIAHRVTPFLHRLVLEHGKTSMSWFGSTPRVTIVDPALAKDVLSSKFGHLEKLNFPALAKVMGDGLASHEGARWAKHRRILGPAFQLEKLKVHTEYNDCTIHYCVELIVWMDLIGARCAAHAASVLCVLPRAGE